MFRLQFSTDASFLYYPGYSEDTEKVATSTSKFRNLLNVVCNFEFVIRLEKSGGRSQSLGMEELTVVGLLAD